MLLHDLVVDDVAAGGDGIARAADGRVVFVRGGVPGDRVTAAVERDLPRRLHAVVADVAAPSRDRVAPPCPLVAAGCGGCGWQHVALDAQRRLKVRLVEESLRRIGGQDGSGTVDLAPPLPAVGFRTTIRALLTDRGLALRGARSHEAVPVPSCLVAHPALDALLGDASWARVAPGAASRRDGAPPEVTLRVGAGTGERLVLVDPAVPAGLELPDDVVVVGRDAIGPDDHVHDVVAGVRFRIGARSFFQSRTDGAEALVAAVDAALAGAPDGPLVDAYGGVGLFGATLGAARGRDVVLVESSASSVADARANLDPARWPGVETTVVRAPVARWRPEGPPPGAIVADPPRAGLGADGVAALVAADAPRIVLVSCDAAAFARDAGLLAEAGHERVSTTLVDLFPHTPHVELVSRFDRVGSSGAAS